jgi:molybdopterin/thiamine biosynthesis adenylyltransferase
MKMLTVRDNVRYERNILVDGIGAQGQARLKNSRLLIVGAGGLGSPLAYYCAAAGFGTIGIVEFDTIELSNLNRQILHREVDIGKSKIDSAAEKLRAFNADIFIETHPFKLDKAHAQKVIAAYDIVADATDTFESKFMLSDVCVEFKKPLVHGAVLAMGGQVMTIVPGKSACLRCVFGGEPPKSAYKTSKEAGILGSVAGIAGTIQATECVKLAAGIDGGLANTLLSFDSRSMEFKRLKVRMDNNCAVCGPNRSSPD